ncbi:Uncharacterised protein [Candidatus Bilamarchaeum dharawalense]|uniref:DUF1697 domain-containing protein n=1 Tax=Candidatus Bilamarchaeum dharawalense TaxID=2885759 RepID=A0A5E4LTK4_9ARCH|nr:Uncharacterised protein [Candidatus Bilamarchaeum dharawalense]
MRYVALLRGINVGGKHKVDMKRLKSIFLSLGCTNVSTYINSGNAWFDSDKKPAELTSELSMKLEKEFGFAIPTIVKTLNEVKRIAAAIPANWQNDSTHKCDVAYLFKEIDSEQTLEKLPMNREYVDIRYIKGAIYWCVERRNYNKSRLNKIISNSNYQRMTVRNVNTARILAQQS